MHPPANKAKGCAPRGGGAAFFLFFNPYFFFQLYSDGDTPVAFLKQRLKYLGSEKPQR